MYRNSLFQSVPVSYPFNPISSSISFQPQRVIMSSPPPQLYSSRVSIGPPQLIQTSILPTRIRSSSPLSPRIISSQVIQQPLLVSSQVLQQPVRSQQLLSSRIRSTTPQPLEKPIVILNSDTNKRVYSRAHENLPNIEDNTDVELLDSLNKKFERLSKMENQLNQSISYKINATNSKEVLIQQIKEQKGRLEDILRVQTIRVEELENISQKLKANVNQTYQIQSETEEELHRMKNLLETKEQVVNKWKSRGSEIDKLKGDLNLLKQQHQQLQSQNQILRNNIQLDPKFNYLII